MFNLDQTLKTSFEAGYELSKKITNNYNKISIPQVSEKKHSHSQNESVFLRKRVSFSERE